MSQLAFTLPPNSAFAEQDFVVSECNRAAFDWIQAWPDWPSYATVLAGPASSGKTHLAHIWAQRSRAEFFTPQSRDRLLKKEWKEQGRCYVLEQADRWSDAQALLHFLNRCREQKGFALLTSTQAPSRYSYTLPDLTSRLLALPMLQLGEPDDMLLYAVLRKQFADRQLRVSEEVVRYILSRMERSFAGAVSSIERLDALSLESRRNITIPLVRQLWGGS